MHPEHLDLLHAATSPSISPDGSIVVVSVVHPDLDADAYRGGLWAVPTDGSPARRLTNGERDSAPAVCPDGEHVAFLRADDGKPPQIHLTRFAGGEPVRLTDQPLGAGAPVWSPDAGRIAWSARVPESGRYGTENADGDETTADAEPPRLVTELAYRVDGLGYTRDRREHLFVAEVPDLSGALGTDLPDLPIEPRQLTTGDADDTDPTWRPDGSALAFISARHDTRESDLRSAVHVIEVPLDHEQDEVPEPRPPALTGGDLSVAGVRWLPDGRLVVAAIDVGETGRDFVGRPTRLWVTEGPAEPATAPHRVRPITGEREIDLDGGSAGIFVLPHSVMIRDIHRGTVRLLAIDPDADPDAGQVVAPEVLVDAAVVVTGQAASVDGSRIVVTGSTADRVGDVGVVRDGAATWLTDASARLREQGGFVPIVEVEAARPGGGSVHGWVLLPDPAEHGDGPHPVLLNIHGGPFAQYTAAFYDEAQVYAGAGYAVAMCNPRGSAGYGFDHGRSIRGAMGTVDADDVLTFLDCVIADATLPIDGERVGVMGGSYGGYMTALLTTRTDRFAAAIVERGYLDPRSFVGSSDIGWFFPGEYHGSDAAGEEQSPMRHVDRVATPTLVIHSETDWRTPIEQGQRWFAELKRRGVQTELLVFPAEGHELSRSGRPRHRRARFEYILRWWAEHLPVA